MNAITELQRRYRRWLRSELAMQEAERLEDHAAEVRIMERTLERRADLFYSFAESCLLGNPSISRRVPAPIHWQRARWDQLLSDALIALDSAP